MGFRLRDHNAVHSVLVAVHPNVVLGGIDKEDSLDSILGLTLHHYYTLHEDWHEMNTPDVDIDLHWTDRILLEIFDMMAHMSVDKNMDETAETAANEPCAFAPNPVQHLAIALAILVVILPKMIPT